MPRLNNLHKNHVKNHHFLKCHSILKGFKLRNAVPVVISLCQDAIKALSENSMLHGRFFYKKIKKEADKSADTKHQSPLRKTPFIRFAFTTPSKSGEEPSRIQNSLNKLLGSLGLLEDTPPIFTNPPNAPAEDIKPIVQPLPQSSPVKRAITKKGGDSTFKIAPRKAKMCQTDFAKCQICEIRKARTFVDKEVQCEVIYSTFGTQVQEDDFARFGVKTPVRDTLKNQSIAHLTPAQLMMQSEGKMPGNFMPARALPDVSPENPNNYRGDNVATTDFPLSSPNFNNTHFEGRSNNQFDFFANHRPKFDNRNKNRQNMNRQNTNNADIRGNPPMRAADFFEGGRQNYGNNFDDGRQNRGNNFDGGRQNPGNNFDGGRQNTGNNFDGGRQIPGSNFDGGRQNPGNNFNDGRQNQGNNFDSGRQNQGNNFDGGRQNQGNNFDSGRQNLGNNFDGGRQNQGNNFDGGRQNFGNNPMPQQHQMQQQMNKRTLLPNPNFNRNF